MASSPHIADLGAVEGEVILFGGPYSNLAALEALAERVGATPAICTGDVVAYCGAPAETVTRLRALGWPVVAGNCERQLAEGAGDCGCGFGEGTECDLLSRGWYAHADAALDADACAWMAVLPDMAVFSHSGRRYAVIHGGATAINRFLWPSSPEAAFAEEVAAITAAVGPVDAVVAGHCGIAFQREVAGVHWINAGAIGLPPHDGRPETRFVRLTGQGAVIERLDYDWQAAQSAMRAVGLVQGYDATLETGVWPSEDVLPDELRR